jgi:hypothetical protein
MFFLNNSLCVIVVLCLFISCGNCEKRHLTLGEKKWISNFKKNQRFYYQSDRNKIDTLKILSIDNYYTPCNKFELSKYQFEVYIMQFTISSENIYSNEESFIFITAEKELYPYIYFGNLGPYRNELENKNLVVVDTVLKGVNFKQIYYYSKDLNTEQYGEKIFFKNFFWNKLHGLIAYTTIDNDFFLRTDYHK